MVMRAALLPLALAVAMPRAHARAQDEAATLDRVQVLGQARPLSDFPGAVDVIEGESLRTAQRRESLAEPLARVPGIAVFDRHNLAQDLQIQSRGFGARSSFGVRGLRLVVDGIPATAADGQGQAAGFPLDTLDRIEVLRGPLALQHGNAAGGVIVGRTDLSGARAAGIDAWHDDSGSTRVAARAGSGGDDDDPLQWRIGASRLDVQGYRPHSDARRTQADAVVEWRPHDGQRLRIVAGTLSQPDTDDPLGLTRDRWMRDPHGTDAAALRFDTRKRIDNHQLGLRWERDGRDYGGSWIAMHGIARDIVQVLAIPEGAQLAPGSGGGVVDVARRSQGIEAGHRWRWDTASLVLGVEASWLDEVRKGYENFVVAADGSVTLGARGRLRRDEDNRVETRDAYLVGDWAFAERWTALAGVRDSRLAFASSDHYIAPGNGDDSGRLDYRERAYSIGLARRLADRFDGGELFASVGRGFETPTVTELAYRPDGGAGFNIDLAPAHFDSGELGMRWRRAGFEGSAVLYRIEGRDEIVQALNQGGRTSYANAGHTRRSGIELGIGGEIGAGWSYLAVANWLDARFARDFSYRVVRNGANDLRTVAEGKRLPGIARASGLLELQWRTADDRVGVAVESHLRTSLPVDDLNTDAAPGHARVALRMDWRASASGWHGFARIDNLFDRDMVGSVIVNEGNRRYFEPAPGRTFTLGLGWQAR